VQLTTVLVKWGWASGTVAVLWGAFILAVFLALFNYPTPSGTFTGDRGDAQRVRPSGRDSGQAGKPVKAGDVLFQIDWARMKCGISFVLSTIFSRSPPTYQLRPNTPQ
jgi:hypothetical protein